MAEIVDSFLGELPRRLSRMREVLAAGDGRLVRVDGTGDSEDVGARVREALAL